MGSQGQSSPLSLGADWVEVLVALITQAGSRGAVRLWAAAGGWVGRRVDAWALPEPPLQLGHTHRPWPLSFPVPGPGGHDGDFESAVSEPGQEASSVLIQGQAESPAVMEVLVTLCPHLPWLPQP